MRTRSRCAAAALSLTTVMGLTGCGGSDSPKLTFQGMEVKDADKSLKTFEQNWRAHFATSETKVRIPDGAGCFYQVMDKEIVAKLLCGPFREAGTAATSWSQTGLIGYPNPDGKGATIGFEDMEGVNWDDSAKALPNAVAMTAAGKKPDLNQQVDEPDVAEVANGRPLLMPEGSTSGSTSFANSVGSLYATDGGLWTVSTSTAKPSRYAGEGADRRQAPKGSVLLAVSVSHEATDESQSRSGNQTAAAQDTEKATTLSVVAGGKTYALPKPDASGKMTGRWLIAVPGDGHDAAVSIVADGGTQTLDLNRKSISGVTTGWTPEDSGTNVSKQPLTQQYSCDTTEFEVDYANLPKNKFRKVGLDCNVKWSVLPYVQGKGWAPQGSQWWRVFIEQKTTEVQWYNDSGSSASYDTTATVTSASLDGQKQDKPETVTLQDAWGGASKTYQVFTFTVKTGTYPTAVTLAGKGSGSNSTSYGPEGAPKTWSDGSLTGTIRTK